MESSTTYTPIMHTKLKLHLERHMYKRGMYKGDAPMGRRGKSEYRVIDRGTHMAVRLHHTDVIRAYEDGNVMIDCNGWGTSMTTKQYLNEALRLHPTVRPYLWSHKAFSQSQLTLATPKGYFRYYDGITIAPDGTITTPLKPFLARRLNKDDVADLKKELIEGGFKDTFKVLWAQASADTISKDFSYGLRDPVDLIAMPDLYAQYWLGFVSHFAFNASASTNAMWWRQGMRTEKRTASQTWSAIMQYLKQRMYETVETEVYQISK